MKTITFTPQYSTSSEKEAEIICIESPIKNVCSCGCKFFIYRPLTGIGIRRICRCCDKVVPYRE